MKVMHVFVLLLLCSLIYADGIAYQAAVLSDNPVGYWKLDESSGSIATDLSGYNNNGTYYNVHFGYADPFGGNSAALFSASYGSYVNISDSGSSSLDVSYLTMEAWISPNNYNVSGDRGMVMNKENTWELGIEDNSGNFQTALSTNSNTWAWRGSHQVPVNNWSHVVVTYDGSQVKHYQDGQLVDSYTYAGTLIHNDNDFRIGARGGDGGASSYFEGLMSEVSIYSYALSATTISNHYNAAFTTVPELNSLLFVALAGAFFLSRTKKH